MSLPVLPALNIPGYGCYVQESVFVYEEDGGCRQLVDMVISNLDDLVATQVLSDSNLS